MVRAIDLNADLGEGITDDDGLLRVVTSANVACGFHAGDEPTMRRVCAQAAERGVVVGAQVSYDDRASFGRAPREVAFDTLRDQVAHQVGVLSAIAEAAGTSVAYLKPHGALYNRVVDDEEQARAVLEGSGRLPVLGLPGSVFLALAGGAGRETHREGFPDRGYTADGRLVPRTEPGALVEDPEEVARHALQLAASGMVASLCVHGDSPHAVLSARLVRQALEGAGLVLRCFR